MSEDTIEVELARVSWNDQGLVPVIAQQWDTGEVLMMAWADEEALRRTLTTGRATYWSRSRQEYWRKGDTSGHVQHVHGARLDCDGDTVLLFVDQDGVAGPGQGGQAGGHRILSPGAAGGQAQGQAGSLGGLAVVHQGLGAVVVVGRQDQDQALHLRDARQRAHRAPEERHAAGAQELLALAPGRTREPLAAASGQDDRPEVHVIGPFPAGGRQ